MGNSWEIHGKFMGNSWEIHGKSMEIYGKSMGNLDFLGGKLQQMDGKICTPVHVFHIFRVFFRAQLEGFFADLKIGA